MPTKSVVIRVEVDRALKAHNCQANARHRLQRGQIRLKVRNGRRWDHYCVTCAVSILQRDITKLQLLLAEIVPSKFEDVDRAANAEAIGGSLITP